MARMTPIQRRDCSEGYKKRVKYKMRAPGRHVRRHRPKSQEHDGSIGHEIDYVRPETLPGTRQRTERGEYLPDSISDRRQFIVPDIGSTSAPKPPIDCGFVFPQRADFRLVTRGKERDRRADT